MIHKKDSLPNQKQKGVAYMAVSLKLPVGIEDFQEIRRLGFYYVDKTKLIEQLLENWGKVNLFTRPRRFGKTLNMSMLRYFFEIGTDRTLFDGLYISKNKQFCDKLVIPNKEVREVYKLQIQEWFSHTVLSNIGQLTAFWTAVEEGNTESIEKYLNRTLSNSISVFDTKARKEEKESSYHNLLVGILTGNADWLVKSNVEAGEGFADIIVETDDPDAGIVAELKYTKNFDDMKMTCQKAIDQIRDRRYQEYLLNDDRKDIRLYGITFCKKRCCAISEKL
mgnify:CR=1 FL=1